MLILPVLLFAQTGWSYDTLTLNGKILNMEREFTIVLPSDSDTFQCFSPVTYLLYNGGGDQMGSEQCSVVVHIADKTISENITTPMIIVMPIAYAGSPGYQNPYVNTSILSCRDLKYHLNIVCVAASISGFAGREACQ